MNRLLTPLLVILLACSTPSCKTWQAVTGTTTVATSKETADQIILRAEQTAETADSTINLFFHLEKDNRDVLLKLNPEIHNFAVKMKHGYYAIHLIQSLRNVTKTFKGSRTAENEASLRTYLTSVNQMLTETQTYINQAQKASVTSP